MRNRALDYLKGIAVLMMLPVHFVISQDSGRVFLEIIKYGNLAPALFMAASGIGVAYQLSKRDISTVSVLNITFLLVSTLTLASRLFTVIAIGMIISAYLYHKIGKYAGYLFPIPFLLLKLSAHIGFPVIFPTNGLLALYLLPILPDFTILPWLSFFFFGIFIYLTINKLLYQSIVCVILGAITSYFMVDKWDFQKFMSVHFFVCSLFAISLVVVVTNLLDRSKFKIEWLEYIGQKSLLFFFIHASLMYNISSTAHPLINWGIPYIVTYILMRYSEKINTVFFAGLFKEYYTWIAFILLWFLLDHFVPQPDASRLVQLGSIIFALNYKYLYKIIETKLSHSS